MKIMQTQIRYSMQELFTGPQNDAVGKCLSFLFDKSGKTIDSCKKMKM